MDRGALVMVHGLWFRAWSLRVLAGRMAQAGFRPARFSYPTTRGTPDANAAALAEHCAALGPGPVHLMGHSLGGLLILHMIQRHGWSRDGRLVFLGTPLTGSSVGRRVAGWPGGQHLLGHARALLKSGTGGWPQGREAGMIAGTLPMGLGLLAGGLDSPHDGTVSLAETRHPGLADHIELAVTHTGLLYSPEVARQAAHFLVQGRFQRP